VAKKTPAATAMAGAHTTSNNKLKVAEAMATETATMHQILCCIQQIQRGRKVLNCDWLLQKNAV
jgi:hypothetical protein